MAGCSRKNRKNSRKANRKNRKNSRRNNMRRNNMGMNMYGGAEAAPMGTPSALNLGQGREFQEIHRNQHGGGSWTGAGLGAPVGDQGLLPQELVASARVGATLNALQEASGMSDTAPAAPAAQAGGARRRRRGSRKSKKSKKNSRKGSRSASRKNRKGSRKNRKGSRKNRKNSRRQRGGAYAPAPYNAPTMLLSPAQAAKAGTADFSNPLLKY